MTFTDIYSLSLHDALPILRQCEQRRGTRDHLRRDLRLPRRSTRLHLLRHRHLRSEEHTSELQSQSNLVCRLLLEKKKDYLYTSTTSSAPPRVRLFTCLFTS